MAVDASIAHERVAGEAAGHEDAEAALFAAVRGHAEAVIAWTGSEQALGLEHLVFPSFAVSERFGRPG